MKLIELALHCPSLRPTCRASTKMSTEFAIVCRWITNCLLLFYHHQQEIINPDSSNVWKTIHSQVRLIHVNTSQAVKVFRKTPYKKALAKSHTSSIRYKHRAVWCSFLFLGVFSKTYSLGSIFSCFHQVMRTLVNVWACSLITSRFPKLPIVFPFNKWIPFNK